MNYNDIKDFIPQKRVDETQITVLNRITESCADFVAKYTNQTIDEDSPIGLIQIVADLVSYQFSQRPELVAMKSEDMEIEYNVEYPAYFTTRMNVYRRLNW